jgi:Ca-activated chloride channel family protein
MEAIQQRKGFQWQSMLIILMMIVGVGGCLGSQACAKATGSKLGCRVELDREVLPADGPQTAVLKVTLEAPPPPDMAKRPAVNLSIVLDRSGSMRGDKLEKAKEAALEAFKRLSPRDVFSLVVYNHTITTIVPAQSAENVEWIESQIRGIGAGGNTALFGGVSQGAAEVRKHLEEEYVHRIILLSDGLANVGPSTPEDLGRLGASLIKDGISVTTVGVGTDYNEDLMTRLSQSSDGNAYFVESSEDLPRIFAAELGDVLSVVAKTVTVIIQFPEDVQPLDIIGREGRIKGRTVEFSLNQLYGSQEKYALVKVKIPRGKNGEQKEIAQVKVSYDNPFTRKKETSTGRASARFSADRAEVKKSANVDVQREYHLNMNAIAQDRAISLADKGKKDAAVKELKQSAGKLRDVGQRLKDKKLLNKAKEIEKQAKRIEQEGMTRKHRKTLRTKAYQQKYQQYKK